MSSNININSQEWCDYVFEGKNKSYGAYAMRSESTKRHLLSILIVAGLSVIALTIPKLIGLNSSTDRETHGGITDVMKISKYQEAEQIVVPEKELPKVSAQVEQAIKSLVFTAPVMTSINDIDETNQFSIDKIANSDAVVSTTASEGLVVKGAITTEINKPKPVVDEATPLIVLDQRPMFPGGEDEMMNFIRANLRYPAIALENGIQGRVTVQFVVSKTGEVKNVVVLRGIDPACDKEAIRVVKAMPRWQAGRHQGNLVDAYFTLPIVYKIQK